MMPFDYLCPASADEAEGLAREAGEGEERRFLAGGQSLLAAMKLRLAAPAALIDIRRLPELGGIGVEGDWLVAGAAVTHASLAACSAIPALAELAGSIGDLQVRNMGTLGGALAHADPAGDHGAAVLGLGAVIRTATRGIAADDFFLGMFQTALEPGEMIRQVAYPLPLSAGYAKLRNPASGYAVAGVFVARTAAGARVAVTGAGEVPFRLPGFEAALDARFEPGAVRGLTVSPRGLNRDLHAGAEYRASLIPVLAARAVARALGEGG